MSHVELPLDAHLDLPFYLSKPMGCPYLPERDEQKVFVQTGSLDPQSRARLNAILCRAGFRRSQDIVYRPSCEGCSACVPVRIVVKEWAPSRSLKRIISLNNDLTATEEPAVFSNEQFSLFQAYQNTRHGDSDMAAMSGDDFAAMLVDGRAATRLICLRDKKGLLLGTAIVDNVGDGVSAVYSFFTPAQPRRSLGSALILSLVEKVCAQGGDYVYLGYWIKSVRKMAYKARFRPMQRLGPNGWCRLEG